MIYKKAFGDKEIRLIQTTDNSLIKPLIMENKSWLLEDGGRASEYKPNNRDIYLLGYNEDNQIIGCVRFERRTGVCVEMHGIAKKAYRLDYAREFTVASIEWLYHNTNYRKILCITPYRSTVNFMAKLGFQWEGTNSAAWLKDGKLHDMTIIGLSL